VGLELETDLDDVEGGNYEAIIVPLLAHAWSFVSPFSVCIVIHR